MAPERTSVRGVGAALNSYATRPYHVESLTLLSFHHADFHCLTFCHAPLNLLWVVLSDRCVMNKDMIACVIVINEFTPVLQLKPCDRNGQSLIVYFLNFSLNSSSSFFNTLTYFLELLFSILNLLISCCTLLGMGFGSGDCWVPMLFLPAS